MRHTKKKLITLSIYTLFMTALYGGYVGSLSWFVNKSTLPDDFEGESGKAFFGGGEGTSTSPYQIKNARHFYNLCWLQYLGRFNKDTDSDGVIDQVYFELTNDIDCDDLGSALPPIGTTRYPFVGNFDGNDHIISNYTITDKYSELTKHPSIIDTENNEYYTKGADTINYCSIIGTFGVIGYNATAATDVTTDDDKSLYKFSTSQLKVNSVDNLYIDNVTIKPATTNTLAGLLAGYVSANMSGCGVHYSKFNFDNNTNISSKFNNKLSNYTLIGDYNSTDYDWDGHEGGDEGFGTSINIGSLYDALETNTDFYKSKKVNVNKRFAVPIKYGTTTTIKDKEGKQYSDEHDGNKMSSSGSDTINPYYASTISASTSQTNIGYFTGSSIELLRNKYSGDSTSADYVNYENLKAYTGYSPYDPFSTWGKTEAQIAKDKEHVQKIKDYLEEADGENRKGDNVLSITDTYFKSDSTKEEDFPVGNENYLIVKDAHVGEKPVDLFIPARGIWVAPVKAGIFEIVAINENESVAAQIAIYRLQRKTPGNYSTGFTNTKYSLGSKGFSTGLCGAMIYPNKVPTYFGVEVTQEDIDAGYEFFITKYTNGSNSSYPDANIVYLDIGTDGSSSETEKEGKLENIDFYYYEDNKLVKVTADNASNVVFDISGDGSAVFYFNRILNIGVLYYDESVSGLKRTQPSTFSGTSVQASNNTCTVAN